MHDEKPPGEEEARDRERNATWEALPEHVRQEALAKNRERARREDDHVGLVWRYRWKYALAGGALALVFGSCMGRASPTFLIILTLACATAAFKIASARLDRLSAVGLYGGGSVFISVVAALTGGLDLNHWIAFFAWLMLLVTAVVLAVVSKIEYGDRFGPF